jgi:hypothetical protein
MCVSSKPDLLFNVGLSHGILFIFEYGFWHIDALLVIEHTESCFLRNMNYVCLIYVCDPVFYILKRQI